jgi:hypothetical protein
MPCCHLNVDARANKVPVRGSLQLNLHAIALQNRHVTLLTSGGRSALRQRIEHKVEPHYNDISLCTPRL